MDQEEPQMVASGPITYSYAEPGSQFLAERAAALAACSEGDLRRGYTLQIVLEHYEDAVSDG